MIRRRMVFASILFSVLVAVGYRPIVSARGDEPNGGLEKPSDSLRYRRVLIPKDRLNEFLPGYFAMKREDFEKRLRALRSSSPATGAHIERARYVARLQRDQLVAGEARLEISNYADNVTQLSFDDCGLAIGEASWLDNPSRKAVVALGADGKLVVPVETSSSLFFPWSLRGKIDQHGSVVFDLKLPMCPMNQVILDLPSNAVPEVDQGIVYELPTDANPRQLRPGDDGDSAHGDQRRRRWTIELGGRSQVSVRIASDLQRRNASRLVLVSQKSTYTLAAHALNLSCDLKLDVYNEPLQQIALDLDPTLHLTSAFLGETPLLPVVALDQPQQNFKRVLLTFSEPIEGTGRLVRLSALAPLVSNGNWRLPSIEVHDVHWQEGDIRLVVLEPLEIRRLMTEGCRQTTFDSLPAPSSGETMMLQCFSPKATVDLVVMRQESEVGLNAGTTIKFGSAGMSANLVAVVTALAGDRFILEADVPRRWIIDHVEARPDDLLGDWRVSARGPRNQRLQLRFRESLREHDDIRIIIGAHRRLPATNAPIAINEFRLAKFLDVSPARHLISVSAVPPYRMTITGDSDLVRLDAHQLSAAESQLVDAAGGATLFVDEMASDRLEIRLDSQPASYSAEIDLNMVIESNWNVQSCQIRCIPETSTIDRLLVHFSHASAEPLDWKVVGESDRSLSARRLTEAEQQTAKVKGGETWEIALRRPRSVSFEILGKRTTDITDPQTVPFVTVLEAGSQAGVLAIESVNAVDVEHDGALRPIPIASLSPYKLATTRAAYRYDPLQVPHVTVSQIPATSRQPAAWVWRQHVESRLANDKVSHLAVLDIENIGRGRIDIRLPPDATVRRLHMDGAEISVASVTKSPHDLVIPLPKGVRFPSLRLAYEIPRERFWLYGNVTSVVPQLDLPVLQQSWTVWLPPGFEAVSSTDLIASRAASHIPWTRRLFGSLDGSRLSSTDSPFATGSPVLSPTWLIGGDRDPTPAERFLEFLGRRKISLHSSADDNRVTLLSLLEDVGRFENRPSTPRVLVDLPGLSAAGITPRSVVSEVREDSALQRGASLLEHSNLVLLQFSNTLILTDTTSLADFAVVRRDSRFRAVALADREWIDHGRLVTIASWTSSDRLPQSPWATVRHGEFDGIAKRGWSAYHHIGLQEKAAYLIVYSPATLSTASWTFFLLAAAAYWWLAGRCPLLLWPSAIVAGCAALLAPITLVSVFTGLFHGVLLGSVLGVVRRRRHSEFPVASLSLASTVRLTNLSQLFVVIAAGFLLLAFATQSAAQQSNVQADDNIPIKGIFKVLMPVDEANQPTGSFVYLPKPFWMALQQRAMNEDLRGWLIHAASYQLNVEPLPQGNPRPVAELLIQYDLEVLQSDSQVAIPLQRKDMFLFADRARLNGQSVEINWSTDGQSLVFSVAQPDRYNLELSFQLTGSSDDGNVGFDFSIPRIPRSRLRFASAADVSAVELPTALGAVSIDGENGELLADLGPADRIVVHWSPQRHEEESQSMIDVDELLWLKVRPSSVVIEALFRFSSIRGPIQNVQLQVDPRLRMLPLQADTPVMYQQVDTGMIQKTISLRLREPYRQQVDVHATFLLSGTSGVGNLRLPRLEAEVDGNRRRLLAVSVSPALEFDLNDQGNVEAVTGDDFLDAWSDESPENLEPPQAAFRIRLDVEPSWTLSTKPRQPRITAEQQSFVSIGSRMAQVEFDAFLDVTDGHLLQHRLAVAAFLRIDDITLRQGEIERSVRWSRSDDTSVSVFLDSPVTGQHRLTMRGTVAVPPRGNWPLPVVSVTGAESTSRHIRVYRRPEVRVRMADVAGLARIADPGIGRYAEGRGRLVAVFEVVSQDEEQLPKSPTAVAKLQPNNPVITGNVATMLYREGGAWSAEVACSLNIKGVADVIRFNVPRQWNGPIDIEPDVETQWIDIPGQNRRLLIVRPLRELTGRYTLRMRGPLVTTPAIRVAAPIVSLLDVKESSIERYLLLPVQLDRQRIDWDLRRLQKLESPPGGDSLAIRPPPFYDVFTILSEGYQATIRDIEQVSDEPQVWLSDVWLSRIGQNSYFGVATFDLEPAGIQHCDVTLPSGCQLVQATVGDLPAMIRATSSRRWRLALISKQLPQRIGIVYTGQLSSDASSPADQTLSAPVLEGINVRQTLFTVAGFSRTHIVPRQIDRSQIDVFNQKVLRFDATVAIVERASDVALQSAPAEAEAWYHRWARRIANLRPTMAHWRVDRSADRSLDFQKIETLERRQAELTEKLARIGLRNQAADDMRHPSGLAHISTVVYREAADAAHYSFEGAVGAIQLDDRLVRSGGILVQARLAILFSVLTVALYFLIHRGPLAEWIMQWPQAVGVFSGLIWWLWLTPASFGWIIMAVSIVASLRTPWIAMRRRSRLSSG